MKSKILALFILFLCVAICLPKYTTFADGEDNYNCKAYVLMDLDSALELDSKNSNDRLPIASMTKLMTILLTLEHIDSGEISLDDNVMVSENASGMGGSQIFLDKNTEYRLSDLLKSVIVASANDSSVALAEYIGGSENNFVAEMNRKAGELNMTNTNYANCTGLPSNNGYSSAHDQAILLREVLKYDTYRQFASIWLEDFIHPSNRTTQMTNTNKLARFYPGCIGGKTGSTSEAKYCLGVGAERNNSRFIAVVLGAENSKTRFNIASELLNSGFANYESIQIANNDTIKNYTVKIKGQDKYANLRLEKNYSTIVKKGQKLDYTISVNLPDSLKSVKTNDIVGTLDIILNGENVETINILSNDTIDESSVWDYFKSITNS